VVHVPAGDLHGVVPAVGRRAREQLEQHDPGRVEVAAGVGAAVGDLLGGQVRHGPEHHLAGALGVVRVGGVGLPRRGDQPEVGDLHRPVGAHQHVLGLHVAVDEAAVVGDLQRGDHLLDDRQGRRRVEAHLVAQDVAQRPALDQLEDEEHGAVGVASLVVHGDHAGVRQAGRRPRLPLEAADEGGVGGEAAIEDLDGHRTVQAQVAPAVHHRHPAAREEAVDAVAPLQHRPRGVGGRDGRHGPMLRGGR
jgi:hypothetical protein